jgi:hypothetical protein
MDFLRLKVEMELLIISRCDILNRTGEMARLYGIQFYDVLSRGSQVSGDCVFRLVNALVLQFRVESMMLRMTRKENFLAPSPSPIQRNRQETYLNFFKSRSYYRSCCFIFYQICSFNNIFQNVCTRVHRVDIGTRVATVHRPGARA